MLQGVTSLVGAEISGIHLGLGVILIEAVLAVLAYDMIVDLDVQAAQKAQSLAGGAPTGYIRGAIVGGWNLRTQELNAVEAEGQSKKRKRQSKRRPQMTCLSAKLELKTPGLHRSRKDHFVQTVQTDSVDDDCSPMWNQSFEKLVTYAESRQLEITVIDRQGKRKHTVGSALVVMKDEDLPELDHRMDGTSVSIGLSWTNPATLQTHPAGSITLQLAFIPSPPILSSEAGALTSSWYFETTVILAVFLNMVVLALQSPTSPPPLLLHGVLRVLEIFCATHMLMEFLMEFSVHLSSRTAWFRDPWLLLLVSMIAVSWLSLASPAMPIISEELTSAAAISTYNVSSAPRLDDSLYRVSGAKTAPAANLIAAYVHQAADGTAAGTKQMLQKLLSVCRVFRIIRPVRTLRMIDNIDIVVTVITQTARLLFTVGVLLLFLLSIFTLIGLSSYTGALQYECLPQHENEMNPECSVEQKFSATLMQVDCPLRCPRALSCAALNDDMWCAPVQGGRRGIGTDVHGLLDFDTFLRGFVATFVQTTGDGGIHSIPLALIASGASMSETAWAISFASSVFLNMLCLNLFLAVLCSAYSDVVSATEERELARQRSRDKYLAMMEARGAIDLRGLDTGDEQKQKNDSAEAVMSIEDRIHQKDWVAEGSRIAATREWLKTVATSLWFERVTSTVIICNTVSMAMVHEDMSSAFRDNIRACELVFLIIFVAEAIIKFVGTGSSIFFSSAENKFDIFVILLSIVGFIGTFYTEEVEALLGLEQRSLASVQSLRGIRLIRALQIIRLLQRQKALAAVLNTISLSWKPILAHSCFCLFSLSFMAIVGMHIFGGSLGSGASIHDYDVETPANLETFGRGLLTFFEMFVGENWSHVMFWYTKYAGMGYGFPHFAVQVFFIGAYIWLNSILFSLCVAMLLENFSVA